MKKILLILFFVFTGNSVNSNANDPIFLKDVKMWGAIQEQTNLIIFTTVKIDATIQEMYLYVDEVALGKVDRDSAVSLVTNKIKNISSEIKYNEELTRQIVELDYEFSHPVTKHFNASLKQQKLLIEGYVDYVANEIKTIVHMLKNRDLNDDDMILLNIESIKRAIKMSQISQGLKRESANAMAEYNKIINPDISKAATNHYAYSVLLLEQIDESVNHITLNYLYIVYYKDENKIKTEALKIEKNFNKLRDTLKLMENEIKLGRTKINYFDEMFKRYENNEKNNKAKNDIKDIFNDAFNQIEKMKDDLKRLSYFIDPQFFFKDEQSVDKTFQEMENFRKNYQEDMVILKHVYERQTELVKRFLQ